MTKSIHSKLYAEFTASLVDARSRAKLSQRDLAKRLGRPHSYVAKLEIGERRIDIVEFIELAAAMEADAVGILKKVMKAGE